MKWIVRSVLLLAFCAFATQELTGRKGCDCSICKGVDNKLNPLVGKRIGDDGGGKSGCNICEKRKEMLRLERERQLQLQNCPFEILGSTSMKGKTSEEIFDEFRELIVPSQNGFFDMMRGVVRTMHGTSVVELKRAKEKEAMELAKKRKEEALAFKKRKEEAEEAKKRKALNLPQDDILSLNRPVNPKVTVVLKQTPCGQIIQPVEPAAPEKISLTKRLPKEAEGDVFRIPEEEILHLQSMDDIDGHQVGGNFADLNSKLSVLQNDLVDGLIGLKQSLTTMPPQHEETTIYGEPEMDFSTVGEQSNLLDITTESPFVKFMTNEEMKALSSGKNSLDDFDLGLNLLPSSFRVGLQGVGEENAQNIDYSLLPISF